jgi:hypothetical protein
MDSLADGSRVMRGIMSRIDEYLAKANELLFFADRTRDPELRTYLQHRALVWITLMKLRTENLPLSKPSHEI